MVDCFWVDSVRLIRMAIRSLRVFQTSRAVPIGVFVTSRNNNMNADRSNRSRRQLGEHEL